MEVHQLQRRGLCHAEGVRYYLDCNRIPGQRVPRRLPVRPGRLRTGAGSTATTSATGSATPRSQGTTEVVCRLVICQNPATVDGLNCNGTEMVDDNTCGHEAGCLDGLAAQLPGGGRRVMVALVSVETVLLVLLVVLVAGLLRSNAELLRRLGPAGAAEPPRAGAAGPGARPCARPRDAGGPAVAGTSLAGDPVTLAFDGAGVVADAAGVPDQRLRHVRGLLGGSRRARQWPGVQTVIVTHGPEREQPAKLAALAPDGVPVVMSGEAWADTRFPARPTSYSSTARSAARAWPRPRSALARWSRCDR